ncbi:hypothetical protein V0288_16120 [Pannus brasiliensis CCIBt3594]|uniref:Uncharacterized protein n=1 Tax=Pannus brasiliensis CCIBt3594 TaxID=1427578 RepID=A0AAW9QLI5_9CHRO
MQLEAQLRILGRSAAENGLSPEVMRQAVNPVLLAFARTLKHRQYHLLQSSRGDWLLTTLARADDPTREKTVIYAFATKKAAIDWQTPAPDPLPTLEIPVTHLLFQLLALDRVDSIIFLDNPRDRDRGREIPRSDLQATIQKQLRKLRSIPPDIA